MNKYIAVFVCYNYKRREYDVRDVYVITSTLEEADLRSWELIPKAGAWERILLRRCS